MLLPEGVGVTIREYREGLGRSQAELARLVGSPQTSVSRWERGLVAPGAETLRKLAVVFNCRMDDITPPPRMITAGDVDGELPPEDRRRAIKMRQAVEYSGLRDAPNVEDMLARIPPDWWGNYTAEHLGDVLRLLFQAGNDR